MRGRVAADGPAGEHDALDGEAEAAVLRRARRELHDRLDEAALGGRQRRALRTRDAHRVTVRYANGHE